jgi:PAS domain S-box-containing protein
LLPLAFHMNEKVGHRRSQGLQNMMDKLPAVVFEYAVFSDGSRDFTYISPRCEELLGVSPEILTGGVLPMQNFIHPEDWNTFHESMEMKIRLKEEFKWEGRVKVGNIISWLEASASPSEWDDGTVLWTGLMLDISQRKMLELKEQESEKKYRDLIEHLPLGLGVHVNQKLVFANSYAASMVGASHPDQLIGKNLIDFTVPGEHQNTSERTKLIESGGTVLPFEKRMIGLDGKAIDVEVFTYPIVYDGQPAIQSIVRNITIQKAAEKAVSKTETLFSQLFQSSPMAVVMLDDQGNVTQVNGGFEEMFGYTLAEVKGRGLNPFIVPKELESEGNDLNSFISTDQIIRTETVRLRKDKARLSVIIYGVPVYYENKTIGIFGVYVDITERKKVEEELKIRNTELDNFVYKVSHDLRAPLSSILGLINLANMPGNDDSLTTYMQLIKKKVEQLDHFINDVLSHSKNLKMEVRIGKVDIRRIIDQTFQDLNYLNGADQINKEILISGPEFYSDYWRIAEIFRNLISNAIKYRKASREDSVIRIIIKTVEKKTEILFQDNGIGIDQAYLTHIFDMFYRASEQSQGSGLGLYIVKNAIEKLGGTVSVESILGAGTTYRISLPNLDPELQA